MKFFNNTKKFNRYINSNSIKRIHSGSIWTEGPCYFKKLNKLVWSDIPNNRVHRWSEPDGVSVLREPSGNANGHTVDLEGRILSCETSGRQVSITELDGSVHPYIHQYGGRKFTSPNDIIVKSDGSVWFSDPDYGALHPELGHGESPEQDTNRVYRFDPETRRVRSVTDELDKPNGLAFSPDESILYIGDTARTHGEELNHHVMAFDVVDSARLENIDGGGAEFVSDQDFGHVSVSS